MKKQIKTCNKTKNFTKSMETFLFIFNFCPSYLNSRYNTVLHGLYKSSVCNPHIFGSAVEGTLLFFFIRYPTSYFLIGILYTLNDLRS